jgi:pimeloyl-ACP methyl ester carboxylesterase/class 3 adenylate cyclase
MPEPETRYARSGDVNIAYQVVGDGPVDLVYVPGFVSNVAMTWKVPDYAAYLRRLTKFCRLIIFDKRGTGMSDRVAGVPNLETRMDDVRAVMDAAGSSRAAILGISEGGPMSALFAATYPERTAALVLLATCPRYLWAPDYSFGVREEEYDRGTREDAERWGSAEFFAEVVADFAPGYEETSRNAMSEYLGQSASPGAVVALGAMNKHLDVRSVLPAIRVPTLVLCLTEDGPLIVQGSRYMADLIPGARLAEIPGRGHIPTHENVDAFIGEIERFLHGSSLASAWDDVDHDRVLATLLFTDIVGSTARAAELGDRRWSELMARHHELVRAELAHYRGQELDTAGDGFFARFDGPARAIRCARSIVEGVHELGLEVRAGLHTGECELFERKVGGIAVSIGARVAAEAGPNEVLVSNTVRDLVAGSGIEFADRGSHELKGVPGEWRLFAVDLA